MELLIATGKAAGAIAAVVACILAVWRIPIVARLVSWVDQHRREDRTRAFEASLDKIIGPRLAAIEIRSRELSPNGGSSIVDRVAKMETIMLARGDMLDGVVRQLDTLQTDVAQVLRKVST